MSDLEKRDNQRDVEMMQVTELINVERGRTKIFKDQARNSRIYTWILLFLFIALVCSAAAFVILYSATVSEALRTDREGLYSLNRAIVLNSPPYGERMEIFCKKGKAAILDCYDTAPPAKKLKDREINDLLMNIFRNSEQFMIDPWIAMAVVRCESNFSKEAVSVSGAKGAFQQMPETAKMLMGDDYFPGCEQSIPHATKMFFKHYLYLSEAFGGDIRWISASYVAGSYYPYQFYKSGKTFDQYSTWFRLRQKELLANGTIALDHSEYMNRISYWYHRYKDL